MAKKIEDYIHLIKYAWIAIFWMMLSCNNSERAKVDLNDEGGEKSQTIKEYNTDSTVIKEYQVNNEGLKNGFYKEFYRNGTLKAFFNYTQNKLSGEQKLYFESGAPQSISFYKDGNIDSIQKWFYPDGAIKSEYYRINGSRFGTQKLFGPNGNLNELYFISGCDSCMTLRIEFNSDGTIKKKVGNLISVVYANNQIKVGDTLKIIFYSVLPTVYNYSFSIIEKHKPQTRTKSYELIDINNNKGYLYLTSFDSPGEYIIGGKIKLFSESSSSVFSDSIFYPL